MLSFHKRILRKSFALTRPRPVNGSKSFFRISEAQISCGKNKPIGYFPFSTFDFPFSAAPEILNYFSRNLYSNGNEK